MSRTLTLMVLFPYTVNVLVALTTSSHPPEIVSRLLGPIEKVPVWMAHGVLASTH
jgi:hypothetical protein